MEAKNTQKVSIYGTWWEPLRKWFYPAWLCYELTIRFYEYAQSASTYFTENQSNLISILGKTGVHTLALFLSLITFLGCTAFLTLPSCLLLYRFFNTQNLTATALEGKLKKFF